MNPIHKALFELNETHILGRAREAFGETRTEITKLGGFESVVFEYAHGDHKRILKCTHTERRSANMIKAEIAWVGHLIAHNIPCVAPVTAANGEYVVTVPVEDSQFHLYAWEKAPGDSPKAVAAGPELWRRWGATLGAMHRVTKLYRPESPELGRHDWQGEIDTDFLRLLEGDKELREIHDGIVAELQSLPNSDDSYGLVHSDFHQGNFFVHDNKLTVFDFDDCHYNWFAQDIAMPLFYFFFDIKHVDETRQSVTREFFRSFIGGYSNSNGIDSAWLKQIPLFLKQRELVLYFLIGAEPDWRSSKWCSKFMEGRRENLLAGKRTLEFDFL